MRLVKINMCRDWTEDLMKLKYQDLPKEVIDNKVIFTKALCYQTMMKLSNRLTYDCMRMTHCWLMI